MTLTVTTIDTTTTHTSLQTWVHHEALECAKHGDDARMFAGYMEQYISLATLDSIISCETYNNMLDTHSA